MADKDFALALQGVPEFLADLAVVQARSGLSVPASRQRVFSECEECGNEPGQVFENGDHFLGNPCLSCCKVRREEELAGAGDKT